MSSFKLCALGFTAKTNPRNGRQFPSEVVPHNASYLGFLDEIQLKNGDNLRILLTYREFIVFEINSEHINEITYQILEQAVVYFPNSYSNFYYKTNSYIETIFRHFNIGCTNSKDGKFKNLLTSMQRINMHIELENNSRGEEKISSRYDALPDNESPDTLPDTLPDVLKNDTMEEDQVAPKETVEKSHELVDESEIADDDFADQISEKDIDEFESNLSLIADDDSSTNFGEEIYSYCCEYYRVHETQSITAESSDHNSDDFNCKCDTCISKYISRVKPCQDCWKCRQEKSLNFYEEIPSPKETKDDDEAKSGPSGISDDFSGQLVIGELSPNLIISSKQIQAELNYVHIALMNLKSLLPNVPLYGRKSPVHSEYFDITMTNIKSILDDYVETFSDSNPSINSHTSLYLTRPHFPFLIALICKQLDGPITSIGITFKKVPSINRTWERETGTNITSKNERQNLLEFLIAGLTDSITGFQA